MNHDLLTIQEETFAHTPRLNAMKAKGEHKIKLINQCKIIERNEQCK